jgi:transposase
VNTKTNNRPKRTKNRNKSSQTKRKNKTQSLRQAPKTQAKQKVLILPAKNIAQFSGRKMANLLALFSLFDDVDISYKTIERAYSNTLVKLIIHNMFIILVQRKGISQADLTGDGTGYSLTITKHYRSVCEKAGMQ